MNKLKKLIHLLKSDIWENYPQNPCKAFVYRWLRILISSSQNLISDKGFDKASTLTFYTILAIVPLLAISFGVAQQLGVEEKFSQQIKVFFEAQPQVADKLIQFSNSTLKTTRGGIIASFGLIMLFWTVIKTIGNIESFFDEIWKIKTPRTLFQSIKSYTPFIILFPLFLVASSSVIIYISSNAIQTLQAIDLGFFTPIIQTFFNLISYLVSWYMLSFLYTYLPNTKVPWKAGLVAGILTGIIFFIWQWIYVAFQIQASSYGIIYGSFAAAPLFLIWLNYSWLIIIFGAEICYQFQQECIQKDSKKKDFLS